MLLAKSKQGADSEVLIHIDASRSSERGDGLGEPPEPPAQRGMSANNPYGSYGFPTSEDGRLLDNGLGNSGWGAPSSGAQQGKHGEQGHYGHQGHQQRDVHGGYPLGNVNVQNSWDAAPGGSTAHSQQQRTYEQAIPSSFQKRHAYPSQGMNPVASSVARTANVQAPVSLGGLGHISATAGHAGFAMPGPTPRTSEQYSSYMFNSAPGRQEIPQTQQQQQQQLPVENHNYGQSASYDFNSQRAESGLPPAKPTQPSWPGINQMGSGGGLGMAAQGRQYSSGSGISSYSGTPQSQTPEYRMPVQQPQAQTAQQKYQQQQVQQQDASSWASINPSPVARTTGLQHGQGQQRVNSPQLKTTQTKAQPATTTRSPQISQVKSTTQQARASRSPYQNYAAIPQQQQTAQKVQQPVQQQAQQQAQQHYYQQPQQSQQQHYQQQQQAAPKAQPQQVQQSSQQHYYQQQRQPQQQRSPQTESQPVQQQAPHQYYQQAQQQAAQKPQQVQPPQQQYYQQQHQQAPKAQQVQQQAQQQYYQQPQKQPTPKAQQAALPQTTQHYHQQQQTQATKAQAQVQAQQQYQQPQKQTPVYQQSSVPVLHAPQPRPHSRVSQYREHELPQTVSPKLLEVTPTAEVESLKPVQPDVTRQDSAFPSFDSDLPQPISGSAIERRRDSTAHHRNDLSFPSFEHDFPQTISGAALRPKDEPLPPTRTEPFFSSSTFTPTTESATEDSAATVAPADPQREEPQSEQEKQDSVQNPPTSSSSAVPTPTIPLQQPAPPKQTPEQSAPPKGPQLLLPPGKPSQPSQPPKPPQPQPQQQAQGPQLLLPTLPAPAAPTSTAPPQQVPAVATATAPAPAPAPAVDPAAPVKRKRGRPPKDPNAPPRPRKPRPKKDKTAAAAPASQASSSTAPPPPSIPPVQPTFSFAPPQGPGPVDVAPPPHHPQSVSQQSANPPPILPPSEQPKALPAPTTMGQSSLLSKAVAQRTNPQAAKPPIVPPTEAPSSSKAPANNAPAPSQSPNAPPKVMDKAEKARKMQEMIEQMQAMAGDDPELLQQFMAKLNPTPVKQTPPAAPAPTPVSVPPTPTPQAPANGQVRPPPAPVAQSRTAPSPSTSRPTPMAAPPASTRPPAMAAPAPVQQGPFGASAPNSIWPDQMKSNLARRCCYYLATKNDGKSIPVTQMEKLLDRNSTFVLLCQALRELGLNLENGELAQELLAEAQNTPTSTGAANLPAKTDSRPYANRSGNFVYNAPKPNVAPPAPVQRAPVAPVAPVAPSAPMAPVAKMNATPPTAIARPPTTSPYEKFSDLFSTAPAKPAAPSLTRPVPTAGDSAILQQSHTNPFARAEAMLKAQQGSFKPPQAPVNTQPARAVTTLPTASGIKQATVAKPNPFTPAQAPQQPKEKPKSVVKLTVPNGKWFLETLEPTAGTFHPPLPSGPGNPPAGVFHPGPSSPSASRPPRKSFSGGLKYNPKTIASDVIRASGTTGGLKLPANVKLPKPLNDHVRQVNKTARLKYTSVRGDISSIDWEAIEQSSRPVGRVVPATAPVARTQIVKTPSARTPTASTPATEAPRPTRSSASTPGVVQTPTKTVFTKSGKRPAEDAGNASKRKRTEIAIIIHSRSDSESQRKTDKTSSNAASKQAEKVLRPPVPTAPFSNDSGESVGVLGKYEYPQIPAPLKGKYTNAFKLFFKAQKRSAEDCCEVQEEVKELMARRHEMGLSDASLLEDNEFEGQDVSGEYVAD